MLWITLAWIAHEWSRPRLAICHAYSLLWCFVWASNSVFNLPTSPCPCLQALVTFYPTHVMNYSPLFSAGNDKKFNRNLNSHCFPLSCKSQWATSVLICTQCHNDTVIVIPLCWLQVTYCDTDSIRLHQKCFFHFTLPHGHSTWPDSNPNFLPTFEILSFLHSCIASQQFLAYVACIGVTANRQLVETNPYITHL